MGTNYYAIPKEGEIVDKKLQLLNDLDTVVKTSEGRSLVSELRDIIELFDEDNHIHLGKRSAGWKFLWNFNGNKYYSSKNELIDFVRSGSVMNEYGEVINPNEFLLMALDWNKEDGRVVNEEYLEEQNYYFAIKPDLVVDGLQVSTSTDFS